MLVVNALFRIGYFELGFFIICLVKSYPTHEISIHVGTTILAKQGFVEIYSVGSRLEILHIIIKVFFFLLEFSLSTFGAFEMVFSGSVGGDLGDVAEFGSGEIFKRVNYAVYKP